MERSTLLLIALSLLPTACTTTSGRDPVPLTPESYRAALIRLYCGEIGKCFETYTWYAASTSCQDSYVRTEELDAALKLVKAERATFNPGKASSCLAAMDDSPCAFLKPEPAPCNEVVVGVVAVGGTCESNGVCASGWCQGLSSIKPANPTGCGRCAARIPVGGSCVGEGCVPNSFCDNGTCVASYSGGFGQPCTGDLDCAEPFFCGFDSLDDRTCTTQKSSGQACFFNQECVSGLVCLNAPPPGYGDKCGPPRALGDVCYVADRVGDDRGDCGGGNACGWDGSEQDLETNQPVLRCFARKKLGENCTSHWECGMIDSVCLGGKCSDWPAIGEPCVPHMAKGCGRRGACKDGVCAELPDLGEFCAGPCISGLSCQGYEQDAKCVKIPALGDPCKSDYDCDFATMRCGPDKKCTALVCL